jgi:hypothetical protein
MTNRTVYFDNSGVLTIQSLASFTARKKGKKPRIHLQKLGQGKGMKK